MVLQYKSHPKEDASMEEKLHNSPPPPICLHCLCSSSNSPNPEAACLSVQGPFIRSFIMKEPSIVNEKVSDDQIKVLLEFRAKIKFQAALSHPMTSISDQQSVPWSNSFQNMYNTYMCKINLEVEKWGFSEKFYLIF